LEDTAPWNALRRTRPRRQSEVQPGARSKNDPRTPQARVPRRTDYPPASYGNLGGRFSTLARRSVEATQNSAESSAEQPPCPLPGASTVPPQKA
jgi:hypothetical protein